MGSQLSCTPGKRGGGGGGGESERTPQISNPPLVSPRFFFFVNFSPGLYYLNAWNRLLRYRAMLSASGMNSFHEHCRLADTSWKSQCLKGIFYSTSSLKCFHCNSSYITYKYKHYPKRKTQDSRLLYLSAEMNKFLHVRVGCSPKQALSSRPGVTTRTVG